MLNIDFINLQNLNNDITLFINNNLDYLDNIKLYHINQFNSNPFNKYNNLDYQIILILISKFDKININIIDL
jgi:hypothetical protein